MKSLALIITLLVCHYLADFCLTSPAMIRAKADGHRVWPIVGHAAVHAVLMGLCMLVVWSVSWKMLLMLMGVELVTHFLIDTSKGRLSASFPLLADRGHKPYWVLYGFDQLLHQFVVVFIWWCACRNMNVFLIMK